MTVPIPSNIFADAELTDRDKWYNRIWNTYNNALLDFDPGYNTGEINPTLGNSWVNYNTGTNKLAAYRKQHGVVYLSGMIKSGTINTDIFVLPAGYLPSDHRIFRVPASGGACRVDVLTTGSVQVVLYDTSSTNAYVSLNGIYFNADA